MSLQIIGERRKTARRAPNLVVYALLCGLSVGNADAKRVWQSLKDDVSRAQNFERIIAAHSAAPSESEAMVKNFQFPLDTFIDRVENVPRENQIFGIDVSHHNSISLSADLLRRHNVSFVYMKATQGSRFADKTFPGHWAELRPTANGPLIYRGAYHFLTPGVSATEQADSFLDYVAESGGFEKTDLPPVVDVEWAPSNGSDAWASLKGPEIVTAIVTWLERVELVTGRKPIIYTSKAWWNERIDSGVDTSRLKRFRIWAADYSRLARRHEQPAVATDANWTLWQFSSHGHLATGYDGSIDVSVFRGRPGDFESELGVAR